jgi:nitroimidazol reductase NimA-like FMN-containing flavoprotein (pyridoxamine 5'-phosphate oxidase superfamily)
MAMLIHQLTPDECFEVLGHSYYGRLACSRYEQPYVVPFTFYLDQPRECLYSFSTLGQKIEWMRANARVCVEVDEIVDQYNWTSVLVFGRYEELGDSKKDEAARRRAYELFQERSAWWLPGAGKASSGAEHHTSIIYRITIDKMSGRRAAKTI